MTIAPRPIDEIHEAVGRLHSAAWHGRGLTPGDKPRFSIPRQPTDDDEIAYTALEELRRLRDATRRLIDGHGADDSHILISRDEWARFRQAVEGATGANGEAKS